MIRRLFVEKKEGFNVTCNKVKNDIASVLDIHPEEVRILIRYDVDEIENEVYEQAKTSIFSEAPVDNIYEGEVDLGGYSHFVVEYLPGQYDQRADSAMQCVQLLSMKKRPIIRCATVYAFNGVTDKEVKAIKKYLINPVEAREGKDEMPTTLHVETKPQEKVPVLEDFMRYNDEELKEYYDSMGFAMSYEDLKFVKAYFKKEYRYPTLTELKVIDTYWSDHCRHTTFATELTKVDIHSDNPHVAIALKEYNDLFEKYNGKREDKYKCLMDIATITVKELKARGLLNNLDTSDEINACSVVIDVDNDGKKEEWLLMFKNETHNHPTEIEPFGGAATCLGGAIRDPLSGRTYVYQAMRVTGAADPTESYKNTMKGKLPQRVITKTAASGYSSYGNQIGLATGQVSEMYHPGYKAKRLETGFVIAAAPRKNVVRKKPQADDIILLLGGETGRDGCGGATGSSKAHTEKSVEVCGAEVQKGNALTERKLQRLFRKKEVSELIIKCNDFGAGGVSVAIGELADSLDIYLDNVTKKYDGLTGTELAISESQERMAVVIEPKNIQKFIAYAKEENLVATPVAKVTDNGRMRMIFHNDVIVDLSREFLNTNGVKQYQEVEIEDNLTQYRNLPNDSVKKDIKKKHYKDAVLKELSRLNVCSTKGLSEMFDSTIGAGTVLMPWGGKYQMTPNTAMVGKIPVLSKNTQTVSVASYACYPDLMCSSPFVGSVYSIVASVMKAVSVGAKPCTIRLTLQEFFKRLNKDAKRWGEPTSALLGAMHAELGLGMGAIGGKDSMSGTFENIDVPPTLISFAVGTSKNKYIVSNTFKYHPSAKNVYYVDLPVDNYGVPEFSKVRELMDEVYHKIKKGEIVSAGVVEEGGSIISVIKSCLGNKVGFTGEVTEEDFAPKFGSLIVVGRNEEDLKELNPRKIGELTNLPYIEINGEKIDFDELYDSYESKLKGVFPITVEAEGKVENIYFATDKDFDSNGIGSPRVLLPVFPGTNCEYDTARAFERYGAKTNILVVKNQTPQDIEESVDAIAKAIKESQIIALPGGFSGGDEPDGSGKFIATTFKNPKIAEAVLEMLYQRDGLMIGICNGFQALIKLGLVPYGTILDQKATAPTLTYNTINRHISSMSRIRVASNNSPWLTGVKVGDVYNVPISHGEGRFVASEEELSKMIANGQIITQYVDDFDSATMQAPYNPNGSTYAIEGIISPDGRVLGKMGHTERWNEGLYKNIDGEYNMRIFESGVKYFK